ncbi:MAG: hypothetical protein ACJAR2_000774 [Ilumatobacter sp.]|jgi:hypothetical protein
MATFSIPRQRAVGVGVGLIIVMLVYIPAGFGDIERVWAAAGTLLLGSLLGPALTDLRLQVGLPGVIPGALLAVLLAMFLCVPETDQFVVAALIPVALLAVELVRREQLAAEWYAVAAGGIGWAGMFGSTGRQSALVGALFAWWPIVLPVLIIGLGGRRSRHSVLLSMAVGAATALVFARTGGISDSGVAAALVVVGLAAISVGVGWLVASRRPPTAAP